MLRPRINSHRFGTLIKIEDPRFSARADSKLLRLFGTDVIKMSVTIEVALVNEMWLPYAAIATSTDYDCWKESE
jgi:5'-methylthioadenosine phosphorylase